ncbi:IS3 family transposase [Cyanobium sp. Morenito 9A2]|uniref:IS3 family transposase n=1 Tax=Cyanobium sp. Morenito 9A2 TaxID=2823718 RepID=UPI0037BE296D
MHHLTVRFSVSWLCRQLGVARSGSSAWLQRQEHPGPRARENAVITAEIQEVLQRHRGFYGSPRVHRELAAGGHEVGRHRVAGLMKRTDLKARTRRGLRPCRKASSGACGVAKNLQQQDFQPPAP